MIHDFFKPQPIKGAASAFFLQLDHFSHKQWQANEPLGAKFYFLRGVLHNHPNHKALQLLGHLRDAMVNDSILLLDEMVLPEFGVNAYAASMDMTMMSAFASAERSEAQWRQLIEDAGLSLCGTYLYNPESYESVMDVRIRQ
ncbi:hypothetical protein ANO14919_000060 [Xylariales sp. No.14919]|nr:hypothetical protein ANO14919_000060 [Xylariales sp. No.14919]